jgi:O-antigen ligase
LRYPHSRTTLILKLAQRYQQWLGNRSAIAILTAVGMIGGFMTGRAILSLFMALFGLNALRAISPRQWFRQNWWLLGIAWVGVYALSWFWSSNFGFWNERLQVKLPVLLFPLAFALLPRFSVKQLNDFTKIVCVFIFLGCCYSLSFLWRDPQGVLNGYFTSKVMPTPAYRDHIRYSILVAWSIIWCCRMFPLATGRFYKTFLVLAILFFTVYLHILAVKSGLMVLYLFIVLYALRLLFTRKLLYSLGMIVALSAGIYLAYLKVPSFNYKINYLKFTYEEYQRNGMSGQFSDMGRVISYEMAWKVFLQHPWIGVGAGDILDEMTQVYHQYYPQESKPLVPHNQFIVVLLTGGLLALVPFILWVFYPLTKVKRSREGFYFFITWLTMLGAMLVEPMLEVQFGVFVYLFCLLWMWKTQEVEPTPYSSSSASGRLSSK